MEYLTRVVCSQPLTIHFCLYNPSRTARPVFIPRSLGPLGVFVTLEIRDASGNVVFDGPTVRATHRLAPSDPDSYRELEAGYTSGVVLEVDDFDPPPGAYEVRVQYTNRPFEGTPSTPVGPLACEARLPFVVSARVP
jgi:hypothetical protein